MIKRHRELKKLAISHVTHTDNKDFATLIELTMANGKSIHYAIISTYLRFPITSGKPTIKALIELENFASSRYKNLSLARIRQAVTSVMNGHDCDVLEGYLTVINMMSYEEVVMSAGKKVKE